MWGGTPLCCRSVGKGGKPNIILIVADDAGYADFSYLGSQSMKSPRIDALVAGGVHFTNMHVSASVVVLRAAAS